MTIQYPTIADCVGNTPLVRLQRLPGETSNTILVKLEGNNRELFWCDVGQQDGTIVLRVDRFIDQDQEFIDDVLSR